ncbi:MAG: hypothetical protein RBT15_06845 [Gudongella sp.]|jgi:hypothetical protein|nr:hypothetical protein [Gudongella sp.]
MAEDYRNELIITKRIFNEFEKNDIKYANFKSNQHLAESFMGVSDYDVLVEQEKKSVVDNILIRFGCKKFEPIHIGQYPGVENWLAYDCKTGVIHHLHLHYQIATGKPQVKDYILPWKDVILNTAIKDEKHDILITDPNVEIILLIARIVLKSKALDYLKACLGKFMISEELEIEYKFLKEKIDIKKLFEFSNTMFSTRNAKHIVELLIEHNKVDNQMFRKMAPMIRRELRLYRRMYSLQANYKSLYYRFVLKIRRLKKQRMRGFDITKKIGSTGGKIIAFIGVDGSGKSTCK